MSKRALHNARKEHIHKDFMNCDRYPVAWRERIALKGSRTRLRILFLTSAFYGVAGYWRAFPLARQLAKRGHEVTIVCQGNARFSHCNYKIMDGVQIYSLPPLSASVESIFQNSARAILRSTLAFSLQTGLNILRIVTSNIDVLHTYDALLPQNALPTVLSKLKTASRKPVVFVDWDDWWGRGGILDDYEHFLEASTEN